MLVLLINGQSPASPVPCRCRGTGKAISLSFPPLLKQDNPVAAGLEAYAENARNSDGGDVLLSLLDYTTMQ